MNFDRKLGITRICTLIALFCMIGGGCSVVLVSNDHTVKELKANLNVYYGYPGRNQFNSATGFYKKETVAGHFAQTKIELDNDQRLLIMSKADEFHFFQMPDSFYHVPEHVGNMVHSFRISIDSIDKTVNWRGSLEGLQPVNYRIKELVLFVDSIVKSTDEYKGLPKSELRDD